MIDFTILNIVTGPGSEAFNYFFTLIFAAGWVVLGIGILFKIIGRS